MADLYIAADFKGVFQRGNQHIKQGDKGVFAAS